MGYFIPVVAKLLYLFFLIGKIIRMIFIFFISDAKNIYGPLQMTLPAMGIVIGLFLSP